MFDQFTAVRTFEAPVEVVREAWLSSSTVVPPVTAVDMEPRVGGRVRISTGGPPESDLHGVFVVVERERLTYTWRWGGSAEETLVEVRLHDAGSRTVVEVLHRGFLDMESLATHRSGWEGYFDGMASAIAST